jgi:hypothetical protein
VLNQINPGHAKVDQVRLSAMKEVDRQQTIIAGAGRTPSLVGRWPNRPDPGTTGVDPGRADSAAHLGDCQRDYVL